jgi:hypothetical protein
MLVCPGHHDHVVADVRYSAHNGAAEPFAERQ